MDNPPVITQHSLMDNPPVSVWQECIPTSAGLSQSSITSAACCQHFRNAWCSTCCWHRLRQSGHASGGRVCIPAHTWRGNHFIVGGVFFLFCFCFCRCCSGQWKPVLCTKAVMHCRLSKLPKSFPGFSVGSFSDTAWPVFVSLASFYYTHHVSFLWGVSLILSKFLLWYWVLFCL